MRAIDYTLENHIIEDPSYLKAARDLAYQAMKYETPKNWYFVQD